MKYKLKFEMVGGKYIDPKGLFFTAILPSSITFYQLHQIIMLVTNYDDYHLWVFEFEKDYEIMLNAYYEESIKYYIPDGLNHLDAETTPIKDLFDKYKKALYTYDFGDNNEFIIKLQKTPTKNIPYGVIKYNGPFPPDDIGGIGGYSRYLDYLEKGEDALEDELMFVEHFESVINQEFNLEKVNKLINLIIS